jgi:nucleoid-associated protein YgaU
MAGTNKDGADFSDVSSKTGGSAAGGGARADFSDVDVTHESTAEAASELAKERTYTVKSGDSLSKIAKRLYGDERKWKAIHAANREQIPNPDLIHPGQTLIIPEA